MTILDDLSSRLLRAVVSAPIAWQTPAELAERLGQAIDPTSDALADLDIDGWLDPWEVDDTVYVTLSPRAAEQLRVRLTQVGRSDNFRWTSLLEPEPMPPLARGRGQGNGAMLDIVADPTPGPEAIAEASERAQELAEAKAAAGDASWLDWLPRPKILLGLGLSPWPGPVRDPSLACPACGSEPIDATAYCLVCDRWGLDHLLKTRKTLRSGMRLRPPIEARPDEAAHAKAARKAKRSRRFQELPDRDRAEKAHRRRPDQSAMNPPRASAER